MHNAYTIQERESLMATGNSEQLEILNKREAARLLGVSSRTLDTWMKRRMVPFSKLPTGSVRFRRSQLMEMLATYQVVGRRSD